MIEEKRVVFDTNVLLDYLLGWRLGNANAMQLLRACLDSDMIKVLCISLSLKDVDYISRSSFKKQFANSESVVVQATVSNIAPKFGWHCVDDLLKIIAMVVAVDQATCKNALKLWEVHPDYEDDLIIAASRQANADMVVTGDQDMIRHFPDLCVSVEDALKRIDGMEQD
ncbi:PIN domain-containing protein [Bifidobacterium sp. ESL0798]|uniref:PIN domain-containing protein n=1 Tax=Bifidobacterium sp. ESL0798 TaxID=2983235 RepID=UPI0023F6B122|nr:PIN domain-containing protein [Bifidobacterium sp. ESL0798]WEV74542.1 PIN domain-containing protein [Bifidobacterium sp. ESL0798]